MSASDSFNRHCSPVSTHQPNSGTNSPPTHNPVPIHTQAADRLAPASRFSSQRNSPYPQTDSFFDEAFAFAATPPPTTNFLHTILNPPAPCPSSGYQSRRNSPPRQRANSPDLMPPTRSARLPNGYVDLTNESSPIQAPPPRTRRRTVTPGPSAPPAKRLKRNNRTAVSKASQSPETKIEQIDLSDPTMPIEEVLQKQRAEAVKAQQRPEENTTTFNTFNCVICMDNPTDITATSCGHLFCHTCLMEALIAGENRSGPNEPKRSQCPVCRKLIVRTKATDIIPLLMKKGLATQPRKRSAASTPKNIL